MKAGGCGVSDVKWTVVPESHPPLGIIIHLNLTTQFPSFNSVLMLIRFPGFGTHLEQVCCMSLLFCWPIQRPCGTDPWRTAAFHLWPFVVSAGHSGSVQRVQPEDTLKSIYLIWPFFTSSKCFASAKLPSLGQRALSFHTACNAHAAWKTSARHSWPPEG